VTYTDVDRKRLQTHARENALKLARKISDPLDRVGDNLVYKKKPRTKSQSFNGYPYIHVDGVNVQNTNKTADGGLVEYTADIKLHVWGREDNEDGQDAFDQIVDELIYLLTGPEKATLNKESGMTAPNILRNVPFTGNLEKDQPVSRQEIQFRTDLHIDVQA